MKDLHQKVLAECRKPCALDMGNWHSCETRHCRGGWIVTLAGKDGIALENKLGTPLAALVIARASSPNVPIHMPEFYVSDEEAMAAIEQAAELEKAAAK